MDKNDEESARKKLGDKLRAAREKAGMTQAQVAAKAKISANYYAVVERGEESLKYERLERILKVLGIKSLDIS